MNSSVTIAIRLDEYAVCTYLWTLDFVYTRLASNRIESIMMGGRVVLTADEENIKAILATQFGSYGKGPDFRREWKDFLGLSIVRSI